MGLIKPQVQEKRKGAVYEGLGEPKIKAARCSEVGTEPPQGEIVQHMLQKPKDESTGSGVLPAFDPFDMDADMPDEEMEDLPGFLDRDDLQGKEVDSGSE